MKRYGVWRNSGIKIFSVAFWVLLVAALLALDAVLQTGLVFAQETHKPEEPAETGKAETAEKAPESLTETEAAKPEAAEKKTDEVALNLNKVKIDQVVKFLSELTGKTVMKHKNAQAEITIVSHEKVPRQEAIRMICESLRLEKVAVVDRDNIIWLIPQDLLPQMDIGLVLPTEELPKIGFISKSIQVKFADVAELEKLLRPLLSEKATLIAHPAAKKIIVTDTVERIANLERVVAELDVLDIDDRQVQIFPLKYADAEELAPILEALMAAPGQAPSGKPAPKPSPGKAQPKPSAQAAGEVEIQPYKAANWLLVVAPKEKLAKIAQLIEQLDREMPQELKVWVIPIQYAEANELARDLGALLKKRHEKRIRDTIEITADTRSNSLIVLASEMNYHIILKVVEELDTEESVQMKTEWFELEYADAEDLAEQLNELYSGLQEEYPWYYYLYRTRRTEARTRFVAEKRTNSLIAIAPPSEFEKIKALVERLDQPIDIEQVAPRVYTIKYSDAKELTDVLNRVFGVEDTGRVSGYYDYLMARYGDKAEVGRLYGKVRFDPLPSINAIIVTTNNTENFPLIEKFIDELDRTAPEAANLLVVTLKNARAEDVAEQLNILFSREGVRAPEKKEEEEQPWYVWLYGAPKKEEERPISNLIGQVRVVEDKRTNSLLITTAVQNHEAIKTLIKQLDAPEPKVCVAVRLIEIIRSKSKRMGIRFSSEPTVFETDDFDNGLRSTFGFSWEEVHGNGIVGAELDISALVQFIARHFNTRILSDTTLTMDNNEEAELFVGAEIPFIEKSQITPEGTRADSFTYKPAGTTLKITPNINQEGKVVMNIFLEASQRRVGEVILGGEVLDTRRFDTMLAVEDGQTIVMGGIMREQEVEGTRGVPILKDIPFFRLVFGKRDTRQETTELVAFITPTVLRTRAEDEAATRKFTERLGGEHNWQPVRDPYGPTEGQPLSQNLQEEGPEESQ
jgi:type II secretory pathway component GspD/PulD (secretin)